MYLTWWLRLYILIPACLTQKVSITQDPPLHIGKVGSEVVMTCEQLTTDHDWMYWYYQTRGQGLKLVTYMLKNNEPTYEDGYKEGYEMNRMKKGKESLLRIKSPAATDQGVYFCASSDAQ
ncbi:hypothetical protein GDO81_028093 [Engystomops pustulosus]|uniref:Ig-like domain-containing protein n=1 Tax=Engystomops pustulosus TaxID=76066 RepID=A0AAV6ZRT0_ENGPU|nr:hypothetical protein GDO81_028093 [Engystomops pustulosus]